MAPGRRGWVPAGHIPNEAEAVERLGHLEAHGPTDPAFTFRRRFGPLSAGGAPVTADERDTCPA